MIRLFLDDDKLNSKRPPFELNSFCASTATESRARIWYQQNAFKINSLRAPDKFLHAPKRNFFKPNSNESLCSITQKNILCFIIESFVAMETLYELCKTDIWSRISVVQNIIFFSKQELKGTL